MEIQYGKELSHITGGVSVKYRVDWQVITYDPFDDPDAIVDMDLMTVEADSPTEAEPLISKACEKAIGLRWPDRSHGTFIPHIVSITDENGICVVSNPRRRLDNYTIVEQT